MTGSPETLLCVANYPANTGYAWDFIESLYARIADHLATHGIRTLVAYPTIAAPPSSLAGSAAEAIELDATLETARSRRATSALIRREKVRVVYFTDRHVRSRFYPRLRHAGARRILVHDHTSGERTQPRAVRKVLKWALARVPGLVADRVIAVSDYVARRQVEVALIPARRVVRVWNGLPVATPAPDAGVRTRRLFDLDPNCVVVVCACRATPEKGVAHLLNAFDEVTRRPAAGRPHPVLIYVGDGPQLAELRALHQGLAARDRIVLAGYRQDARALLDGADLCVVPSVWQDAFPLSVLEPMARGKPVIATRVGGIPELIEDGVTGLLVPATDEPALAAAIAALLGDPARAAQLGTAARIRVAERFAPARQLAQLTPLVEEGFSLRCAAAGRAGGRSNRATPNLS